MMGNAVVGVNGSDLLAVSVTVMVLALVGLLIWQGFRTYQTRLLANAHASEASASRALAEQATRAQEQANGRLALLQESVADLATRVASIERILKDVE